jgi:hypothetical protein
VRFRGVTVAVAALAFAGSASAGISASSAQPAPSSVRISWRSDRPAARSVVELGLNADYGLWSKVVTGLSPSVTIGGLEPRTTYRYRIVGQGTVSGAFTTQAIPASSGATATQNAILVDGQPFFPRMVFRECPDLLAASLAAGINLFVGGGCGASATLLDAVAGRAYSVLDVPNWSESGRGLIGFAEPDEADEHGGTAALVPLPPSFASSRISMLNLTNHFFSGASPLPQGRAMYPQLVQGADFVGFDLYPLAIWCQRRFLAVYDAQRELEQLAAGRPTFQWIEAGPMTGCSKFVPTPASLEAETWLAIAAGARGIGYFPDSWQPDMAAQITTIDWRIRALAPALLAPERPVSTLPNAVRAGARTLSGATYVIAVNSSSRLPAKARIVLPGFTGGSIRVYGEARVLPVRDGVFTDSLAPLQARIYVAPPPGAP